MHEEIYVVIRKLWTKEGQLMRDLHNNNVHNEEGRIHTERFNKMGILEYKGDSTRGSCAGVGSKSSIGGRRRYFGLY